MENPLTENADLSFLVINEMHCECNQQAFPFIHPLSESDRRRIPETFVERVSA